MLTYFSLFVLVAMFAIPPSVRLAIQEATASASAGLIGLVGIDVTREGVNLLLPGITLAVDWACTAVTVLGLFVALVLAYDTTVRLKVQGTVVGSTVIMAANQLRILGTAAVAQYWPRALYFMHDYLFQLSMVIVVLALWIVWLELVNRAEATDV